MGSMSASDSVRRAVFERSVRKRGCSHLDAIRVTVPEQTECGDCRREGTRTVHLRMCLTCGTAGCCDSSEARHARRHHEQTGHPMIRSIEPGERWLFCYVDRTYLPGLPNEA